jgi:hypothetical protein
MTHGGASWRYIADCIPPARTRKRKTAMTHPMRHCGEVKPMAKDLAAPAMVPIDTPAMSAVDSPQERAKTQTTVQACDGR